MYICPRQKFYGPNFVFDTMLGCCEPQLHPSLIISMSYATFNVAIYVFFAKPQILGLCYPEGPSLFPQTGHKCLV